jgi:hypothetical protein
MSQYGVNLEIRDVQSNHCLDVERKATANYSPVNLQACSNGTNQRWRLNKATINVETGVICRSSPAHPERECTGVNDQQKSVHLGKTLTKGRCEDVCKVNRMVSCQWGGGSRMYRRLSSLATTDLAVTSTSCGAAVRVKPRAKLSLVAVAGWNLAGWPGSRRSRGYAAGRLSISRCNSLVACVGTGFRAMSSKHTLA